MPIDQLTLSDLLVYPIWEFASEEEAIEGRDAVLLPDGKYVFVDSGSPSSRRSTAKALGMSVSDLFPLTYTLRVLVGREKKLRSGVIA